MSRPARTKRGVKMLDRLTADDLDYFAYGFSFFKPFDDSDIPRKWKLFRETYLDLWMTFQPFKIGSYEFNHNEPGTRPWAWWNLDNPKYRRKFLEGRPGEEGEHNNGVPRYYHGDSTYESQAAFLQRMGLLTSQEREYFELNEMPQVQKIL